MSSITKAEWGGRLKEYLAEQREAWRVPYRALLSREQEFQCRIQGGSIVGWLEKWGPQFIAERNFVSLDPRVDKHPLIIIRTMSQALWQRR